MRPALVALALLAGLAMSAEARAPCVTATPDCQAFVPFAGGRVIVYRTWPLDHSAAHIRRALIMVHGALRNADRYFATATAAGFLAGALDDTLIIAPAFHSADGECHDQLAPGEISRGCGAANWRSGGVAASQPKVTSFDFMDHLLELLADRRRFPSLKVIVIAGHSAGGQFVTRYEMANQVHDRLGVGVQYVVANPSSYAWPDDSRALAEGPADPAAAHEAWKSEAAQTGYAFGPFDAAKAPGYDDWPYGLEHRSGYAARLSDETLKAQLASRPTTYLLGQVDVLPLGGFDGSPRAMAQGPTRRARGEAFVQRIGETLAAHPRLIIVPECGHNDRSVFTTPEVLGVLFPPTRLLAPVP